METGQSLSLFGFNRGMLPHSPIYFRPAKKRATASLLAGSRGSMNFYKYVIITAAQGCRNGPYRHNRDFHRPYPR
jgi:hypothetical protein